jgi:DNA repair exonuclease SbcCD nuclease subunit
MKFLHTADWQLGMKAVQVGGAGERVRQERLKTASRIVQLALEQAVDFILLAGDIFEDHGVERVLIQPPSSRPCPGPCSTTTTMWL